MKPRRTHVANFVFRLEGGTEDNDLWVHRTVDAENYPVLCSCWEPSDEERAAIAAGANIELAIWGTEQPPVAIGLTDMPLGRPPA